MKTLTRIATLFAIIVVPVCTGTIGSAQTTRKTIQPREVPAVADLARSDGPVRVADTSSEYAAANLAATLGMRAIIDYTGLYVSLGGGLARMNIGGFAVVTQYNETLNTTDTSDAVWFGRGELGFQFGEHWDFALSYTGYGDAEVQIAFPKYPNIASILPLPDYKRHVLKYRIQRIGFVPTFRWEEEGGLRFGIGAGITCNQTKSHIEATYQEWVVGMGSRLVSVKSQSEDYTSWSGIVSVSADYVLFKRTTLSLAAAYAPCSISVPARWYGTGTGSSKPTRETVRVDTLELALSLNSRW